MAPLELPEPAGGDGIAIGGHTSRLRICQRTASEIRRKIVNNEVLRSVAKRQRHVYERLAPVYFICPGRS